jgi:hypothetical protein
MDQSLLISAASVSPANIVDISDTGLFIPANPVVGYELLFGHDSEGAPKALIVSKERTFSFVDPKQTRGSKGLFVHDTRIEISPQSAYDAEHLFSPYGALVRTADKLLVIAREIDRFGTGESAEIILAGDLPVLSVGPRIGFYEWSIVIGVGAERQVIKTFRLEPADGPPR